jgi:isoamylase
MSTNQIDVLQKSTRKMGVEYFEGVGFTFAVASKTAKRVTVVLFRSATEQEPYFQFDLTPYEVTFEDGSTDTMWSAFAAKLLPDKNGVIYYNLRVGGDYDPARGLLFDYSKNLVDPLAAGLTGDFEFLPDGRIVAPKCIAFGKSNFDWRRGGQRLRHTSAKSVLAEVLLPAFTRGLTELGEKRGKYSGFVEKVSYLKSCGFTGIQLMPIFPFLTSTPNGLINDWGYQPYCWSGVHPGYASNPLIGSQREEFKEVVRACHEEDMEVILDVVYNHSAEGNHLGPNLSLKGIDNREYFFLNPFEMQFYLNWTGCGNTLNCTSQRMIRFILQSMQTMVSEYRVDGFRFDLAKVFRKVIKTFAREQLANDWWAQQQLDDYLAGRLDLSRSDICQYVRDLHAYMCGGCEEFQSQLMTAIEEAVLGDPVLRGIKIIAEPWDPTGNVSGHFGSRIWAEWYDKARIAINRFWAGELGFNETLFDCMDGARGCFPGGEAFRRQVFMPGSHDGPSLLDSLMYDHKKNWANLEDNQDGPRENEGGNCGAEGNTDDPAIIETRGRKLRNILANLLLSNAIPMLQANDLAYWTKGGNNNTWCQPPLNDFVWQNTEGAGDELRRFFKMMVDIRQEYELGGREVNGKRIDRLIVPHGTTPFNRDYSYHHSLFLAGEIRPFPGESKSHLYFAMNASKDKIVVQLPEIPPGFSHWARIVDTSHLGEEIRPEADAIVLTSSKYDLSANTVIVLVSVR